LPLFEFIGKQFFLTQAGEKLLECNLDISQALDRLEQEMQGLKGMKTGTLNVSVVSSAKYFMPNILGKFREKFPQIKVKLEVSNRLLVKNHLLENETDFGIYSVIDTTIQSEHISFLDNPLVFIAAPNSEHANISTLGGLAEAPFINREMGSGTRIKLEEFLKSKEIKPEIVMELATTEAVKQAVMAGFGVSLVTKYAIKQELQTGAVKILDIPGAPLASHWHLKWLSGKHLSPAAKEFKSFLLSGDFNF